MTARDMDNMNWTKSARDEVTMQSHLHEYVILQGKDEERSLITVKSLISAPIIPTPEWSFKTLTAENFLSKKRSSVIISLMKLKLTYLQF